MATEVPGTKTCLRTLVIDEEIVPEKTSEPPKVTQQSGNQNPSLPTLPAYDDLTKGRNGGAGSEHAAQSNDDS